MLSQRMTWAGKRRVTCHHKQPPRFSPMSPRPQGPHPTGLTLQVATFGGTLHSRLCSPSVLVRLIFLLVFSTLWSPLTVLPHWVNIAPVHTSITGFLPGAVGGSFLGSQAVLLPCPFVLGLGRQAEEEQRVLGPLPHLHWY